MKKSPQFPRRFPSSRELDETPSTSSADRDVFESSAYAHEHSTTRSVQLGNATLTRAGATTTTFTRFTHDPDDERQVRPSSDWPKATLRGTRPPNEPPAGHPAWCRQHSADARGRPSAYSRSAAFVEPYAVSSPWQSRRRPQVYSDVEQVSYHGESPPPRFPPRYFQDLREQSQELHAPLAHGMGTPNEREEQGYLSNHNDSDVSDLHSTRGEPDMESVELSEEDDIPPEEPNVPKTSRYLREMDRRVILDRLSQGEKQATLAKEFNVSRAAISNLFKHRYEILARSNGDPFAKHPKKKKQSAKALSGERRQFRSQSESDVEVTAPPLPATSDSSTAFAPIRRDPRASNRSQPDRLNLVNSPAVQLLLAAMSNRESPLANFHRMTERVLWILLEEALAHVPLIEVEANPLQQSATMVPDYAVASPPCAVSMEQQSLGATPMLRIFKLMEPRRPAGSASVATRDDRLTVEITDTDLPCRLRGYHVFVFDVVAASGDAVCATIQRLLDQFGAVETNLSLVTLFASSEVVAMVQCQYPRAKIVTTRIDSTITRRRVALTPVDLILHRIREAYQSQHQRQQHQHQLHFDLAASKWP